MRKDNSKQKGLKKARDKDGDKTRSKDEEMSKIQLLKS